MKLARFALVAIVLLTSPAFAAEPLLGTWKLDRQEVNGQSTNFEPLTLRITPDGDKLAFAFSVPVNKINFVSMSYTVKLDGSPSDVKNANSDKVGTVEMTPSGASQYKVILKGPNHPDSIGRIVVSPDGKILTSETDTTQAGPNGRSVHSKQTFSRN